VAGTGTVVIDDAVVCGVWEVGPVVVAAKIFPVGS
jgi:hypothetical protein